MPRGVPNPKVTGKPLVQSMVGAAGKSLADLIKTLQEHGDELSQGEFDKIFPFLRHTVDQVEKQARQNRVVSGASSFSFEMEISPGLSVPMKESTEQTYVYERSAPPTAVFSPPKPARRPPAPVEDDLDGLSPSDELALERLENDDKPPSPAPRPPATEEEMSARWKKPVGRVSQNSPNKELAGQAVHVAMKTAVAPLKLEGSGDKAIGFE